MKTTPLEYWDLKTVFDKLLSDYHQSSARDPFDGMRSLTAFEMTSRGCHLDEHSEEKSPGVSSGYYPETIS